jgi:hypothetical protein
MWAMKKWKTVLGVVACIFLLAGCANADSTVVQATPTSSPASTIAATSSVAAALPTQALPTPDFLNASIAKGFLLAPSQAADCQLPCWQGFRIGVSKRQDVRRFFNELFGFSDSFDVFQQPLDEVKLETAGLNIPGTYAAGYIWPRPTGAFEFYMLLDENSGTLQGIQLLNTPIVGNYKAHTPQDVIKSLGAPSSAYAKVIGDGISLMLLYGKLGIAAYSLTQVAIEQRVVGSGLPPIQWT